MQIHNTIAALRAALGGRHEAAFVPTMGNLHEGHVALTLEARRHAATVVASIFVNRLQFGPNEDFDRYPRSFHDDCQKLAAAGVEHLFAPDEADFYPHPQRYFVDPDPFQQNTLDGAFRPGHFRGVATVVLKLFNAVQPRLALFGKKDYQQLMVIRNMVREFALPIEIIGCETVRAADGLALSSRNGYLSAAERSEAPRLFRTLSAIREAILGGENNFDGMSSRAMAELARHNWAPDYIAVRKQLDLESAAAHDSGLVILAAARLGSTRLIDNLEV